MKSNGNVFADKVCGIKGLRLRPGLINRCVCVPMVVTHVPLMVGTKT